jgi:hypothetical protein
MCSFTKNTDNAIRSSRILSCVAIVASMSLLFVAQPSSASASRVFRDGFESPGNWQTFEEVVGGSDCYGSGIGQVARTNEVALAGSSSLRVAANVAESLKSNHLIAHQPVFDTPASGKMTFIVWARQEPEGPGRQGETGPEISVQSTAADGLTTIAGVQYLTNPHAPGHGTWQIWQDVGGRGGWSPLFTQPIQRGVWYQLVLEADFTTGRYLRFTLTGPGAQKSLSLTQVRLGVDAKGFTTPATEVTLEAENLYNNCGTAGATSFRVHYDELLLVLQG